jgi:hypothetical protein
MLIRDAAGDLMQIRELTAQLRVLRGAVHRANARGCGLVLASLVLSPSLATAASDSFEGPSFRQGMWRFERTMERVHAPTANRYVLMQQDTTRCVDPTISMKETFAHRDVGRCHSLDPEKVSNRYIFPNRCDYMGPVRTEITVESDSAYIEVNALNVGAAPVVDTVVARRVGECHGME